MTANLKGRKISQVTPAIDKAIANTLGRGITDAGMAMSAAAALGVGAWRVSTGCGCTSTPRSPARR